jgi:uncharacterized protein DUF3551
MKKLMIVGVILSAAATQGASAQERVRANERYCLEASSGRGGSGGSLLCRFESFEQCMASRTTPGDRCMLNPALAGQPIR